MSVTSAFESRGIKADNQHLNNLLIIAEIEEESMRRHFQDASLNVKAFFLAAGLSGGNTSSILNFMDASDPDDHEAKEMIVEWLEKETLNYIRQVEIPE